MKEKGFTLIELLAVITVLALIVLIVTPLVTNMINTSKTESRERSIDMYAKAVKTAISVYQVETKKDPTNFSDIESYIEYDGNKVVCEINEIYSDGNIYLAGCKVNNVLVDYAYGEEQH